MRLAYFAVRTTIIPTSAGRIIEQWPVTNNNDKTTFSNDGNYSFQMSMLWGQQWFRLFFLTLLGQEHSTCQWHWAELTTQSGRLIVFQLQLWCRFLLLVHWTCQCINATAGWFFKYLWHGHCNFGVTGWLFEVSPGSFFGIHYHFCFWTNFMLPQPLQLRCLQWMHAVAEWQCGRSPPPTLPKSDHLYAMAPAFFRVVTARWKFFSNFNSAAGSFSTDLPLKGCFLQNGASLSYGHSWCGSLRYFLVHPAFLVFLLGCGHWCRMYFLQHNNQSLWHCLRSGMPTAECTQNLWNALLFFRNACFFLQNAHFFLSMRQFAMSCLCCQSSGKVDWAFVNAGRKVDCVFDCAAQQSTCATMASNCHTVYDLSMPSLWGRLIF